MVNILPASVLDTSPNPNGSRDLRETRKKAEILQDILNAGNNKSELLEDALTDATKPATALTGIESLPAELTDEIWSHAFGPPVSKTATSYKSIDLDKKTKAVKLWAAEPKRPGFPPQFFARGSVSAFYSLRPPPLAQICHASRQYALEKYGLESKSDKAIQKKRSNNKRRWTYECPLPVVADFLSHYDISSRATLQGPLALTPADWIAWLNDEDLSLSFPLNVLLRRHGRVILYLDALRYGFSNPFQGFNLALLDFLLSARDHEVAIALTWEVSWYSSIDRCLDRNPSLAGWAHRKFRYVSIDDTAAFRELVRISDYVSSQKVTFEGKDTCIANMIALGARSRAELAKRALKPFEDLRERVNQERVGAGTKGGIAPATAKPPTLRPFPTIDIVVRVSFDHSDGKTWKSNQEELGSMVIQNITHRAANPSEEQGRHSA